MLFRSPRCWPLAAFLLVPLLAQADPLNNGALGLIALVGLAALGLAVGAVALTGWAYLRPTARGVYWAQFGPLALCLVVGLWLDVRLDGSGLPFLGRYNPLLSLCLPLAAWLNGVTLARRAAHERTRRLWVGVAALALTQLLLLLPHFFLERYLLGHMGDGLPLQTGYQVLAFAGGVAGWAVVARQVGHPALWQPQWRTPAAGAAVAAGFFLLHLAYFFWGLSPVVRPDGLTAVGLGWGVLRSAGLTWAAGVLALLVIPPKEGAVEKAPPAVERQTNGSHLCE